MSFVGFNGLEGLKHIMLFAGPGAYPQHLLGTSFASSTIVPRSPQLEIRHSA